MPAQTPPTARPTSHATELGLVGMAVIWGVNFSVVKYGTQVMAPLAYNVLRMGLGCVVLLALATLRRGPKPTWRDRLSLMGLGVLGHCIYQVLFITGLARTRAGTAALVVAASPAVVAIVARATGHERLPRRAVLGIALSIAGVVLVLGGSLTTDGAASLIGDLLILGAVVCWGFYTSGLVPYTRRVEPVQLAAWTLVGGVVPLAVIAAPALWHTAWATVSWTTWGAVAYSGILAMVIAYQFWYRGVLQLGPTRTAMYANLQPLVAVLVAWLVLHEVPTITQGLGAATVIGGLYLSRT